MKLVFWTALNSYRSDKWLRGKPAGTPHPVTTPEWTNERIRLWRRYTLPGIQAQTVQDWLYVVLLDPDLRYLTGPLLPNFVDPRIIYCYEDGPVLEQLRQHGEIVLALIDGDDMYSRTAGEVMLNCPSEWMYFRRGFALEAPTGRAWRYDTIGTGPFFARRIDPRNMTCFDREKRNPTHKAVIEQKPTELPAGHFCVVLHEFNTSSRPDMRYVLQHQPIDPRTIKHTFGGLS